MKTIAIACEKSVDSEKICQSLRGGKKFQWLSYKNIPKLIEDLENGQVSALIIGVGFFNQQKIHLLNAIHKITKGKPLIMISNKVCATLRSQENSLEKNIFYMSQLEINHLPGVLNKLFMKVPVSVRKYFRFKVRINGTAFQAQRSQKITIENISKGGLLIRNRGSQFNDKEKFWVEVPSYKSNDSHFYLIQVAWRKVVQTSSYPDQFDQVIGGKFIAKEELAA